MYSLVRSLIDNGLMSPQFAPFVTIAFIVLIAVAAVDVLTGSGIGEEEGDG